MENVLFTINLHSFWTWLTIYVFFIPVAGIVISVISRQSAKKEGRQNPGDACRILLCGSVGWLFLLMFLFIVLVDRLIPSCIINRLKPLDDWLNGER